VGHRLFGFESSVSNGSDGYFLSSGFQTIVTVHDRMRTPCASGIFRWCSPHKPITRCQQLLPRVYVSTLCFSASARLLYPLVRERAADGFLVTVTCPMLTFSPQGSLKFIVLGVGRTTLRHRSRRPCLASRCSVGPSAHPPALVRRDFHIPSRLPYCTSYTLPCGTLVLPFSLCCSFDLTSQL
jgi:hypothetical protein